MLCARLPESIGFYSQHSVTAYSRKPWQASTACSFSNTSEMQLKQILGVWVHFMLVFQLRLPHLLERVACIVLRGCMWHVHETFLGNIIHTFCIYVYNWLWDLLCKSCFLQSIQSTIYTLNQINMACRTSIIIWESV